MHVTVLSTGGTIASTGGDDGASPTKRGNELVSAVPELAEYADIDVDQVAQIPSFEMDAATLESIGDRVRELDGDASVDAVVITHGTDTIEETAYYLDVTIRPETPVFLTGAQRRPDEYSPDGPSNLLTAFRAADVFDTRGHGGVFVAFDETIHAARRVTKTHTSKLETFRSVGAVPVATVDRNGVAIHRPPGSESTYVPATSLTPAVYTIKSASGVTGELLEAALERGADGLVVEGTGLGNATKELGTAVRDAIGEGVPVVVTSRCLEGRTAPVYGGVGGGERLREYGAIFAGDLPAQKARIKLTLALAAHDDEAAIRRVFAD
ncbi:asparaginase [Haloarchaeobius amylolyticus]|uniref:L-asparaginase n=1 Tax=Haloarchaeobius amylolyticus TaxID=1198296 RepID=A0ABD6BJP7_9EURY